MSNFTDETDDNFGDFDLDRMIKQEIDAPDPMDNPNANRWGFMFLKNLPLYKHTGNNVLIDANVYNPDGTVLQNSDYFPKNQLMMLRNVSAPTPAEGVATLTESNSYDEHAKPFNANLSESGEVRRSITKTAAQCANYFISSYGKQGGVILHSLTGVESYKEARELFYAVLPLNDRSIFPKKRKVVLGEVFQGPFLYEILSFLQSTEAQERLEEIEESRMDARTKTILKELFTELLTGARKANAIAKGQIADTESQIAATPQRKNGYDIRDTTFRNAPEPFDLVCLAHLDQLPKDERQVEAARRMQETSNLPLRELTENLQRMQEMQLAQMKQSNPMAGLSIDQINEIVAKQVAAGIEAALLAQAAGSDAPEGKSGDGETDTVANTAKTAKKAS